MTEYTIDQLKMVVKVLDGWNWDRSVSNIMESIKQERQLLSPDGFVAIMNWLIKEGVDNINFYSRYAEEKWGISVSIEGSRFGSLCVGKTPQEAFLNAMIQYLEAKDD